VLAFVGRLAIEKRIDLILEAMLKAKSFWKLKIIGDGILMDECKKWVKTLRLENQVAFLGWQNNPLMYMKDVTALVCASDYEGLMVAGIEAMAMGKMLISTPNQSALEYLKEGENGYYFNFDNADALAQILDDISFGKKEIPSPEKCMETVSAYRKVNYFETVKHILLDAYEKRTPA
jgi:glycosyltransferase involved in cell wall biosynthesis